MRIIFIDIDSLRPDHLSCYGYHRDTSPAISAIARDGVLFEQVYTSDAPCLPARTALHSGRFGIQTGAVGHGGTAAQPKPEGRARGFRDSFGEFSLAAQLQKLGLHTATISPFAQRHSAHWFTAGFHEVHNTGQNGMESAEAILPHVQNWLAANQSRDDWFLHINLWDTHTPYRAPASCGDLFIDQPLPAWLADEALMESHKKRVGYHTLLDITGGEDPRFPRQPASVTDLAGMRRLIDGYDMAIRQADSVVARVTAMLRQAGLYDGTAIIIAADHGENFGELGIYAEHATADAGTCHIPLIVKFPGCRAGTRHQTLHYLLDLAPTLIELLCGTPPAVWDGASFAGMILKGEGACRQELILSQCAHVCQRAVRWDRWLYIRTYHDGFHLFPEDMLFDLAADPHETADLAAGRREVCAEGYLRLSRWHEAQMRQMARSNTDDMVDPLWTVIREGGPYHAGFSAGLSDVRNFVDYLERLKATGRADGAAQLLAKHRHELDRWGQAVGSIDCA